MAQLTTVVYTTGALATTVSGTVSTLDGVFSGGPVTITTAAAVTAASLALPVAWPSTAATVSISTAQLASLGQATAAGSVPVVVATNQSFSTGALFPVGPIRTQKGVTVVTLATTTETVIATAVSSTFIDLYAIIAANTSATATTLIIKDVTAGTTKLELEIPAGDTRGIALESGDAITMATAGNNWTGTLGTSVASVIVTSLYKLT